MLNGSLVLGSRYLARVWMRRGRCALLACKTAGKDEAGVQVHVGTAHGAAMVVVLTATALEDGLVVVFEVEVEVGAAAEEEEEEEEVEAGVAGLGAFGLVAFGAAELGAAEAEPGGLMRPDQNVIVAPLRFCFLVATRLRSASIRSNSLSVARFTNSVKRDSASSSACDLGRKVVARRSRFTTF